MGNCFKAMSSSEGAVLLRSNEGTGDSSAEPTGLPPAEQETAFGRVYYLTPNEKRAACELTEEEQVMIAKRICFIQRLPKGVYDNANKERECVICMEEFLAGQAFRFLPCMHIFHMGCIDDWLMRSFTCPSCMKSVDVALLTTYNID